MKRIGKEWKIRSKAKCWMQSNGRDFIITLYTNNQEVLFLCVYICFFVCCGGSLLDKVQLNPTWFSLKYM